MNKKSFSKIQLGIIIFAIMYAIGPDPIIGPIDDGLLIVLSGIAEAILAIVRLCSSDTVPVNGDQTVYTSDYYMGDTEF